MQFRFNGLLQQEGWTEPAYVLVDDDGIISAISEKPIDGHGIEAVNGFALPGFQNAHSHAFQYAMAGEAENHPAGIADDFWTWREAMYRCALSVNPDQAEAIAAMLYAEMLRHGYTHVAEFHYLHHNHDGIPYDNPAEMGFRMVRAAKTAGIGITLIPVFYQTGNFGIAPDPGQRRFINPTVDAYLQLFHASKEALSLYDKSYLAWSIHSLRAARQESILELFEQMPTNLPFHIHAAEQLKEVSASVAYSGLRPVQWLLENLPVNRNFFIVHATHLDDNELRGLATSGATVVLCPGTEGNLGDGIFRMKDYVREGGQWCIGTDSHISLNPMAEFRMMDYRQRLVSHRRNTFDGDAAQYMVHTAFRQGKFAMGIQHSNHFAPGQPLDAVVYDADAPLIAKSNALNRLATLLYTSDASGITGTMVSGKWVVKNNQHISGATIRENFLSTLSDLK